MNKTLTKIFATVVFGIPLAFVAFSASEHIHSVEKGEDYLKRHGYTNIEGGEVTPALPCGRYAFARSYVATDENGERGKKTVCFNLSNTYTPLLTR